MSWTQQDEHSWHAEDGFTIYQVGSWGPSPFEVWHRGVQLQREVYIPSLEAAQAIAQEAE